jgi:heat shock protein HtpX
LWERHLAAMIVAGIRSVQAVPLTRGNPAHSHMFIVNPFFGGLQRLFSTHPPVEERIRRLQLLAAKEDRSL